MYCILKSSFDKWFYISNCSEYYKQYILYEVLKLDLKECCTSFDAGQCAALYNRILNMMQT